MASVERIQAAVRRLVLERQALHERNASRDELEANRLELASLQREFSLALIDRCLRPGRKRRAHHSSLKRWRIKALRPRLLPTLALELEAEAIKRKIERRRAFV